MSYVYLPFLYIKMFVYLFCHKKWGFYAKKISFSV